MIIQKSNYTRIVSFQYRVTGTRLRSVFRVREELRVFSLAWSIINSSHPQSADSPRVFHAGFLYQYHPPVPISTQQQKGQ